ncbi:DUF3151 domain-containing protein [Phytomonospora endophytica]|uniref:DUF3151 domain-containing protein n=1 Tax=Phytomonospora endophytica TaxID=714109 RepID=A0A841FJL7_9ACTN|nr:DUF3151 domain-containing protein [Phytomonospora endophytica]MBB6036025.1 hypothetical protein [Phytomonospora endophytica]GIG66930.1 hypothetical protein Pen01_32250 [Phytomonospora endophytica]
MPPQNLMPEPPATLLPENTPAVEALKTEDPADVARQWPDFPAAWAALSAKAMEAGDDVAAYAYARTGYHRALDQLRKNGWRGHGPVPWSHKPNRGFLTSLYRLSVAAAQIGEADEAARCAQFLRDSDPAAADALSSIG